MDGLAGVGSSEALIFQVFDLFTAFVHEYAPLGCPGRVRLFPSADVILGCLRVCGRITQGSSPRKSSFGCHELFEFANCNLWRHFCRERIVCCIFDFDLYLRHVHFPWASSLNRIASVEPPYTTTYIRSHAMVLFVALCLSDVRLAPTRQVPLQCAFIFFRRLLLYHCLQTRF